MTKQEANTIKKVVRQSGIRLPVYYDSKKLELRYMVAQWYDGQGEANGADEKERVLELLNAVSHAGFRPKFRRSYLKYQGFINNAYLIFE